MCKNQKDSHYRPWEVRHGFGWNLERSKKLMCDSPRGNAQP